MKYIAVIILIIAGQMTFSQSYDLAIVIPNLKNQEGQIHIGIYNTKETFPHEDDQYRLIIIETSKYTGVCYIRDLPRGEYDIAIFHDENADKRCNRNLLGFPREGYGFSNNIRPELSAPSFKDCIIVLNQNREISIELIYRNLRFNE